MDSGKYGKVFTSQYCTPDTWYPAAGRTGRNTGKDQSKEDYPAYVQFMKNQFAEHLQPPFLSRAEE